MPYNCLSEQGQITPQIRVTGLPLLPLWTPLVILNNYFKFEVDRLNTFRNIQNYVKMPYNCLSKQGQITPQIRVTGIPLLPLWTPLVILNNYFKFEVDRLNTFRNIQNYVKMPYNCLSKQGQITPQIRVTGLPLLPLWTPLVILNNYFKFEVDRLNTFRNIQNYVKMPYNCLSKQGQITPQIRVTGLPLLPLWTPLVILNNYFKFEVDRLNTFRNIQNYVKMPYNCLSKQGQITPQIRVTGLPLLPLWTPLVILNNYFKFEVDRLNTFRNIQNYVKMPYNCLSKQGQITPQIRVTGLPLLPLWTPLVILNNHFKFEVDRLNTFRNIQNYVKMPYNCGRRGRRGSRKSNTYVSLSRLVAAGETKIKHHFGHKINVSQ